MVGGINMPKLKVIGKQYLSGELVVSGAKNSAVALIPASILCDEVVSINNVPNISDIDDLENILTYLNADVVRHDDTVTINSKYISNMVIPSDLSKKLRASYYFMGALLGRFKKADMYFPGGC